MLSACSSPKKFDRYRTPAFEGSYLDNVDLIFEDTLQIPVPDNIMNFYMRTALIEERYLYGISILDPLNICKFDIEKGELIDVISLDRNILGATDILSFAPLSEDSILIATWPQLSLFMIDSEGAVIDRWDMESLTISNASTLENFTYYGGEENLYCTLTPGAYDERGEPCIMRHGVYSLKERQWISLFGPYEGVLKYKGDDNVYYPDMHHPYQLVEGKNIYVTYPVDHKVYIYSKKTKKLESEVDISPEIATIIPLPLEYNMAIEDPKRLRELRNNSIYYGPLYYHKDLTMYSRFCNYKSNDEWMRTIIVYDRDFNRLCEKSFLLNEILAIQPSAPGFIIQPYNPYEADIASFIKVTIKKREE